jgi:hypothetical protein
LVREGVAEEIQGREEQQCEGNPENNVVAQRTT